MAVDRWFMGMHAKHNFALGGTYIVTNGGLYDTYLIYLKISCTDLAAGAAVKVWGTLFDTPFDNPAGVETAIYNNEVVTSLIGFDNSNVLFHLAEGTRLFLSAEPNAATAMTTQAYGTVVKLPHSNRERTFQEVAREAAQSNSFPVYLAMATAATTKMIMEYQVDAAKPIIQPGHQATPAVADELNVVSTSVLDVDTTGTGARTIKFEYYESTLTTLTVSDSISLNGTTPVNILADYPDVYYITRIWCDSWGALGTNQGNIFLQDDA